MKNKRNKKIPKIKKKISSFLLDECGKVSKTSLIKIGVFTAGMIAITPLISEDVESTGRHRSKHGSEDSECEGEDEFLWMYEPDPTDIHGNTHANTHLDYENHGSDHGSDIDNELVCPFQHKNQIEMGEESHAIIASHTHEIKEPNIHHASASTHGSTRVF